MKKLSIIFLTLFSLSIAAFAGAVSDQEDFIKVAEKAMPAVVNISTERTIKQKYYDPFEEFFSDPFFGNGGRQRPNQKEIKRKSTSLGSGFVISEDGYVITNNHVIDKADKIEVVFSDKSSYKAKIVGADADTDVAVLKIETNKKFPFVEFADSDKIRVGQWAIAIGNPFGLNNTMTVGIVSAKGRSNMGIENYENFIQTDASINPGNSGGPLVDITGKVIGINTAIYSQSGGNVGIGFAIPINMAKKITDSLIKKGKVERGWLGVSIQPLDENMAKKFGIEGNDGALVGEVIKDSPAEKAGVKRGDIIIAVDDKQVKDYNELRNTIAGLLPETKAKLSMIRGGKKIEITVTLGKRAESLLSEAGTQQGILGMQLKTLDSDLIQKFGYDKNTKGVVVLEVENDSQAADSGIKPGDVILEVNNQEIGTLKDFVEIYNKTKDGESILLYLIGKNSSRYIMLEKPAAEEKNK